MSFSNDEKSQSLTSEQLSLFENPMGLDETHSTESGTECGQLSNEELEMFIQPALISTNDPAFALRVPDPLKCTEAELVVYVGNFTKKTKEATSVTTRAKRDRRRYAEKNMLIGIELARKEGRLGRDVISRMEIIASQTREGAKVFPELAILNATAHQHTAFVRSTALALASVGGAHRKNMCRLVLKDVPNAYAQSHLRMSASQLKHVRDNRVRAIDRENVQRQDLVHQKMLIGIKRKKITEPETHALELFFLETTSVLSGIATLTRDLDMSVLDWGFELFSRYPRYLHALGCAQPHLLEKEPNTKFLREMRAASTLYAQSELDSEAHVDLRRRYIYSKYVEKQCLRKGWPSPNNVPELTDGIQGVEYETFLNVVKELGYKWTKFVSPYPCTLCDNFDIYKRKYDVICAMLSVQTSTDFSTDQSDEIKSLVRQKRILFDKLNECRLHVLQVVACRAEAEKARDAQLPGSVYVTRDYVNHHDSGGTR